MLKHPFFVNRVIHSEETIAVVNENLIPNNSENEKSDSQKSKTNQNFISLKTLEEVILSALDVYLLILFSFFISLSLYPGLSNTQYLL